MAQFDSINGIVVLDNGGDSVSVGSEFSNVLGGTGNDTISHSGGSALITGSDGNDLITIVNPLNSSFVNAGRGADTVVLESFDQLDYAIFLNETSIGQDLDADSVTLSVGVFSDVPDSFTREIKIFGFVGFNDTVTLRLPEGATFETNDRGEGLGRGFEITVNGEIVVNITEYDGAVVLGENLIIEGGSGDAEPPSDSLDLLALTPEQQITAVYIAYFGRAPDPEGLNFWISEHIRGLAEGKSPKQLLSDIADSFSKQAETFALFPFFQNPAASDPGAFVDAVFDNLFNRAPDPAGRAFWISEINARLTDGRGVGTAIVDIISGAQNTEFGQDVASVSNKIEVGVFYANEVESRGAEWTLEDDQADATILIRNVTDQPASVDAGQSTAQSLVELDLLQMPPVIGVPADSDGIFV